MITAQLDLVKALPEDLKTWSSNQKNYIIKTGQLIFIQSQVTNLLEGPYILGNNTDTQALADYLLADMLYVPVSNFESKIPIIHNSKLITQNSIAHAS